MPASRTAGGKLHALREGAFGYSKLPANELIHLTEAFMKHLALLLCLLLLVPAGGLCEKILWEDDAGQVVLSDDGNVQFVSPGGEAAVRFVRVPNRAPVILGRG